MTQGTELIGRRWIVKAKSSWSFLWQYLQPYQARLIFMAAMLVTAAAATLALPYVFRSLIDLGVMKASVDQLHVWFMTLLLVIILLAAASASRFYAVSWLAEKVVIDVRHALFEQMIKLDRCTMSQISHAEWVSTMHTDTTLIERLIVSSVSQAVRNVIMAVGAWVMLWATSWALASAVMVLLAVLIAPLMLFIRQYRLISRQNQDAIAQDQGFVQRILSGLHHFQIYHQTARLTQLFKSQLDKTCAMSLVRVRMRAWLTFFLMTSILIGLVGIVYLCFYFTMVKIISMSTGELGQFFLYAVVFGGSLSSLSEMGSELARASGAADRIRELMDLSVQNNSGSIKYEGQSLSEIVFKDVSFSYQEGKPILHDLNLTIQPGLTSVVGVSGCGKSTFVSLLLRQNRPQTGHVRVNGTDVFSYAVNDYYKTCSWCAETDVILPVSIRDNIRIGDWDAPPEEIERIADIIQVSQFAQEMPRGLDSPLQEFGKNISQGMRQRILLARALLKKAPLTVLDEATNALDGPTEKRILEYLQETSHDKCVVFIGHRLTHLDFAKQIIVLANGSCEIHGSREHVLAHSDLLKLISQ